MDCTLNCTKAGKPMKSCPVCRQGRIARDFFGLRRLSVVGLARKYGRTVSQIEAVLRKETCV
jgi:hypothetical protein